MSNQFIQLTPEQISKAISEYLRRHDQTALKVEFNVQTDMTDQSEPTCIGKLVGATVELIT